VSPVAVGCSVEVGSGGWRPPSSAANSSWRFPAFAEPGTTDADAGPLLIMREGSSAGCVGAGGRDHVGVVPAVWVIVSTLCRSGKVLCRDDRDRRRRIRLVGAVELAIAPT